MGGIKRATIENPRVLISHTNYRYPVNRVVKARTFMFEMINNRTLFHSLKERENWG